MQGAYDVELRDRMAFEGLRILAPQMMDYLSAVLGVEEPDKEKSKAIFSVIWGAAYGFAEVGLEVRQLILDNAAKKDADAVWCCETGDSCCDGCVHNPKKEEK